MNPLATLIQNGCQEGQGFGGNANPLYASDRLEGHPGVDVDCGYGTPIAALAAGYIYSTYPVDHPAADGYTAVFTICETALETFEFSYGHVSEIDCKIGDTVAVGQIIAKEGNKGPVYSGNRLITLAEQAAGDHEGSHRHYQKRPVIKVSPTTGHMLMTATGTYRDEQGLYYQIYDYYNGFNGCTDWTLPLFDRNLSVGASGYDVYLLQKALRLEGFATFAPRGFFGALTMASVVKYQRSHGVTPTGFVGPLTRSQLNTKYKPLS